MTEQTNIPKPASPLPWRVDEEGFAVFAARPEDDEWAVCERTGEDQEYIVWAANNALKLYEMLSRVCKYLDGGGHIEANSDAHMDIDELLRAARGEA